LLDFDEDVFFFSWTFFFFSWTFFFFLFRRELSSDDSSDDDDELDEDDSEEESEELELELDDDSLSAIEGLISSVIVSTLGRGVTTAVGFFGVFCKCTRSSSL